MPAAFAVPPLLHTFGLPKVPVPARIRDGQRVRVSPAELVALAAAMRALAAYQPQDETADGYVKTLMSEAGAVVDRWP